MPANLTTTLHYYYFCIDKAEDKAAYKALCKTLRARGSEPFDSISLDHSKFYKEQIKPLDGQTVELETAYLFGNQWNTAPCATSDKGLRVFDWSEAIYPNRDVKEGMYLDPTPEMVAIRETTYICGYCGKNYPDGAPGFCYACIHSEYIKSSELFLLRLLPITEHHHTNRSPLTPDERATLEPLYLDAQIKGKAARDEARYAKEFDNLGAEFTKKTRAASTEYHGKLWLHVRHMDLSNVIYYEHTNLFRFGWLHPIDPLVESELRRKLLEDPAAPFPFPFEIKTTN